MIFLKLTIVLFAVTFSPFSNAKLLELVKEHSKISFDIDYMLMTKVEGQFKDFHGTLNINEEKGELYQIKIIALASTIDTNDGKRDFHLRGQEFFFTTTYPELIFEAKGPFKISAEKNITISGNLTMRGIKKPLVLVGVYKGKMKDPWNKDNYFFELTGAVNRKDFGMIWNKKMDNGGYLIGDNVNIKITVQSQASGEKTPFSTHMIPSTKGIIERDQLRKGLIKKLTTSTDPKDYPAKK
jgi:polyisoprenoid-binding protein YceI